MYLLTGCLCGEVPAARSRPPCRAGGFQAESRVAGADGMRSPRQCLGLRQRAAPFLFQKLVCPRSRRLAGSGKSTCLRQGRPAGMLPEAGGVKAQMPLGTGKLHIPDSPAPPGNFQQGDNAPSGNSRWRDTTRFCQGQNRQTVAGEEWVKAQTPPDTGKPFAPDNIASPGHSQQGDTARFCQGQNRQTVAGEEGRQSANAIGYREAARSRQHRLAGALPAAGHGPVLPNGGWRRAVSKLKRFQRLSGARAPCSRKGGPGRWTAPAGRSRPPPPGRLGGG